MRNQWSLILALVFALITAAFAVINVDSVPIHFWFSSVNVPLILVILGCTLLGGLIIGAVGLYRGFLLQRQIKHLTEQLDQIQKATSYNPEKVETQKATEQDTPVVDNSLPDARV